MTEELERQTLRAAVEEDHPNCTSNTCDIAHALKADCEYTAAFMLQGATDAPKLEAALKSGIRLNAANRWPKDWANWIAYHTEHGVECSCGAVAYEGTICDNCRQPVAAIVTEMKGGRLGEQRLSVTSAELTRLVEAGKARYTGGRFRDVDVYEPEDTLTTVRQFLAR